MIEIDPNIRIYVDDFHPECYIVKLNGLSNSFCGPAVVKITSNGTKVQYWLQNGYFHNDVENEPAIIRPLVGKIETKEWYLHGERHHIGGPAFISYRKISWFLYGKRHRIAGPASFNVKSQRFKWFIDDYEFSQETHRSIVKTKYGIDTIVVDEFSDASVMYDC